MACHECIECPERKVAQQPGVEGRGKANLGYFMGCHVYILRCSDGSLYIGHTQDLASRIDLHNRGMAAKWTAARRPVSLVYEEQHPTEQRAIERERQLKRWSRQKKQALINGDLAHLKRLAKRQKP